MAMHLVPVSIDSIRLHQPLPFPLMDKDGFLLARKWYIVNSRDDLALISLRGGGLYIDIADSAAHRRAYLGRLHGLVSDGKSLGEIASARVSGDIRGGREADENDERADWLELQEQTNAMLRDSNPTQFMDRLDRLQSQLRRHLQGNPDGALFALIHLSAEDVRLYSATHAMLVGVMCALAAQEVLKWPEEKEIRLFLAALTMNLSMTGLQDQLARQVGAPSPTQRSAIDAHATKSADMLVDMGVLDTEWLQAVQDHHTHAPGRLNTRTVPQQMARLIQRADMFAARLAPRASRVPIAPAAAMQACYFDENGQVDEAGAALIKAVGIYQPGSFVRLATEEVAIVIRRGLNTNAPRVAVLVNRSGMPTLEPIIRDTSVREYKVVNSVPHREVKVKVNLERLLPLTATPTADRSW